MTRDELRETLGGKKPVDEQAIRLDLLRQLRPYLRHKNNCNPLDPMTWPNKTCTCGLSALLGPEDLADVNMDSNELAQIAREEAEDRLPDVYVSGGAPPEMPDTITTTVPPLKPAERRWEECPECRGSGWVPVVEDQA